MPFPDTFVLGATGRIGRLLQQCWQGQGQRLLWQGRSLTGLQQGGHRVVLDPLAEPYALAQAALGRQILCLAGTVPPRGALGDNWMLAAAALRAAAPGQRVILCSSAAVYGAQPGKLQETAPLCPLSAYGLAKQEMELRSRALAAQLGVSLCVLRIGNIAGLDACLGGWSPGAQLDQFPDGSTPMRSYIGGITLARILAELLRLPQLPAVLNLAQPGLIEMAALLEAAGLNWAARAAATGAIAKVELDTTVLQNLLQVPPGDAAQMTHEWRKLGPVMTEEKRPR